MSRAKRSKDLIEKLLEKEPQGGGAGYSVQDIVKQTGMTDERIREKLRALHGAGLLAVSTRKGTNIAGRPMTIPVYRCIGPRRENSQ